MAKTKPIILAGPTASGKTDIALALARAVKGEVLSVDSRQIYKMLTVGTAAPKGIWKNGVFETEGVPYHLVDFLDINDSFDISKFVKAAGEITSAKADTPFIFAGGTGMYFQGYFTGMDTLPRADDKIRKTLKEEADTYGKEYLHDKLKKADPASAAQIPPGNLHRVMRALEIYLITGSPASSLRTGKFNTSIDKDKALFVYLNWDKEVLNRRIVRRTNIIFEPMVAEAKEALKAGYAPGCPGLKSLGYREAIAYINGEMTKQAALERIIILTRQYAKRQRTWFARYENMYKIDLNREEDFNPSLIAQRILEWKQP